MKNNAKISKEHKGPRQHRLSIKQLKFVQNYFDNGGNASKAALDAGYSGMHGRRLIRNDTILSAIEEIKKENGLTEEFLLQKHMQLMNAKRTQSCDVYIQDDNGKYKVNENSNDFIEVDDNNVQLGALKLAYEINGKLVKKIEQSGEIKLTQEERDARIDDLRRIGILN